jgi:hypothetical protein
MSDLIYANIDDDGNCVGIVGYQQPLLEPTNSMILIDTLDESLLSKRWTGEAWVDVAATPESAREWRDNELLQTDWIVPITDHPQRAAYISYRAELRDWPADAENFPDTKPTL